MLAINLFTPEQLKQLIAARMRTRRLYFNLSRESLEKKSGVSASTIKRFETTGEISLDALLRLAIILEALQEFNQLFPVKDPIASDFNVLPIKRKRGRQ
jgi:transcriptional regulator with XRE-family HTH domain